MAAKKKDAFLTAGVSTKPCDDSSNVITETCCFIAFYMMLYLGRLTEMILYTAINRHVYVANKD